MNALVICIVLATAGIDTGWERRPEGGVEYIIQLNPQAIEALQSGSPLGSDVQPGAGEIRSFRIVVGSKDLPREEPPVQPSVPKLPEPQAQSSAAPNALTPDPGGRPLSARPAVYVAPDGAANKPEPKVVPDAQPEEPAKPWWPLTFTLLGLFASLGANMYLGWIAWGFRRRCRDALATPTAEE